ncbi:hypothetical protein C9I47_1749 [Lysobacter maris]|uniref:Acriflavine resistance protein B n=2 Tax=Marilutibacter maris TaxID=1605891 RepID=A0A2U9TA69_9GAMM|nr:hypothetical protein C9I47_1749 [Lysobacter maris]
MVCVFGLISLLDLPLQLFPDIERPQMSIQTSWRSASPQEIESEIVEPIETVMQGLPGLEEISSNISAGNSWLNMTFAVGSDMDATLVEVLSRMNRLPPLPRDANPPVVRSGGFSAGDTLTYFFVQKLAQTPGNVDDYRKLIEDRIVPRLTAIDGVAGVEVYGNDTDELAISVDPQRAAALGIQLPEIAALAARATDVSGGSVEVGRREYVMRFAGRYSPEALGGLILAWRDGRPVRLADVASIDLRPPPDGAVAYQNGNRAFGLRVLRANGANVLATLENVVATVDELRESELRPQGLDIAQSFDSGIFIRRAIGLLSGSLVAGLVLAVACLWWFLRDVRATGLIACAIPISILATFIVLKLSGRSLNVISLAGLAFAVGMVMDAAVVVAENIVRLRESGMPALQAALQGTRQVGGALLASTLTTVAVFLPVIFMEDVEGQLFSDLALTIAIAVGMSLLVAITVLPAAAGRWLGSRGSREGDGPWVRVSRRALAATASRPRQLAWIAGLVAAPILLTVALMPRIDYLPPVQRAAADANIDLPPGMSIQRADREIAPILLERMRPYMDGDKQPKLRNWYLNIWGSGSAALGARTEDPGRTDDFLRILREEITADLPDTMSSVYRGPLFGGFGGSARAIAIHLQHPDADALIEAAELGRQRLTERFPEGTVRTWPNVAAATPELRIAPDDRRLAEVGWRRSDLATVVRTLGDGHWLGEQFDGDSRMPIILRGADEPSLTGLRGAPLATPYGGITQLADLARIDTVLAPSQLRRLDGRRTVSLTIDPPASMSLQEALEVVDREIVPALRGELPSDAEVRVSGSADRLDEVVRTMGGNFAMALLVLFMLMAAMFRSLRDSAYVMATLPMALLGGVLGLQVLNLVSGQSLDLLSMIGFIMLLGMVINNAILLVAQTREAQAEGLDLDGALHEALSRRLRPILIAALTGVMGALPMAVNPGPGAEIYRGMAVVTVGGIALSLVFTVLLIPALLRLLEARRARVPAAAMSAADAVGSA